MSQTPRGGPNRGADRFDLVVGDEGSGVRSRRARSGPETELVQQFLLDWPLNAPGCCRITVFQEPRLLSGFPDLVAVLWHEPTAMRWDAARARLSGDDFRLIHILATLGPQPEERLAQLFHHHRVGRALEQLAVLGLVSKRRGTWRATALRETFAVRRIIAFEAKVSDWRSAIEQASLNKWFTSESYVLLPRAPRGRALLEAATKAAVGVWIVGEPAPVLNCPPDHEQPVSYASWLFNEWAWRCAQAKSRGSKELPG